MTKSTITREQAQKIIVAADEVITALAGTNEDVHPDDSKKMCELWDDLNDRHAPPVVVRELARMALAAMDSEPVAYTDEAELCFVNDMACMWTKGMGINEVPLYRHAQPAPVVPDELPVHAIAPYSGAEYEAGYRDGWNACRAAMLAAAPQPQNAPQNIPEIIPDCWCRTCRPVVLNDMRFVVCPDCGNKRCPRENDHRNACTGSNEPGQEGSEYPAAPQEVK